MKKIALPLNDKIIADIKAGEHILLSGEIITGRDAVHKRLYEMITSGKPLPFDIKNQTIYYTGPCPKSGGAVIGSCGPTTSGRVDVFTPLLLEKGLKGMIGKGPRSIEVINSIKQNNAVYFAAIGGAGALYSRHVKSAEVLCFEELLSEAVFRLYIEDFPVIAATDCCGGNIFD
jgi:fumarate hydratase subunit beta